MSYRELEIYKLAHKLVIDIHRMSLNHLPKFEMFEEGSQIRRSSKSVKSNIVEGYGRRRYLKEYVRFLIFAQASNDETLDHLETLYLTGSLANDDVYSSLKDRVVLLGKKINLFIQKLDSYILKNQ